MSDGKVEEVSGGEVEEVKPSMSDTALPPSSDYELFKPKHLIPGKKNWEITMPDKFQEVPVDIRQWLQEHSTEVRAKPGSLRRFQEYGKIMYQVKSDN